MRARAHLSGVDLGINDPVVAGLQAAHHLRLKVGCSARQDRAAALLRLLQAFAMNTYHPCPELHDVGQKRADACMYCGMS